VFVLFGGRRRSREVVGQDADQLPSATLRQASSLYAIYIFDNILSTPLGSPERHNIPEGHAVAPWSVDLPRLVRKPESPHRHHVLPPQLGTTTHLPVRTILSTPNSITCSCLLQYKCFADLRPTLPDWNILAATTMRLLLDPPLRPRILPLRLPRRLVRATMVQRLDYAFRNGIFILQRQRDNHGDSDGDGRYGGHSDQWHRRLTGERGDRRSQETI